jgi:hypothetical protein
MAGNVCFPQNNFLLAITIVIVVVSFLFYRVITCKPNENQDPTIVNTLKAIGQSLGNALTKPIQFIKGNNENQYPDRRYQPDYTYSSTSQPVGYVYNVSGSGRYPLYLWRQGKKYLYHVTDNSKSNIRIPLASLPQYNELSDDDTITIPELMGDYKVKLYDIDIPRYNPTII